MADTPIFDELRGLFGQLGNWSSAAAADHSVEGAPDEALDESALARNLPGNRTSPLVILVAGGSGVGKTTFVRSVSGAAAATDLGQITATDFGQIALDPDIVLHLYGISEQPSSDPPGALGAIVLVDPRRIDESFTAINYFENDSDLPFLVVVNMFNGELAYELDELREALSLGTGELVADEPGTEVPLLTCDARNAGSTAQVLQELISYTMALSFPRGREESDSLP